MPFISIASLAKSGVPWEGTRFRITDGMNVKVVVGADKKAVLDENGNRTYELKPNKSAEVVTFLGQTPDKTGLRIRYESNGEEAELSSGNTTHYVERLSGGGRRRTRRGRKSRKTRRGRKH